MICPRLEHFARLNPNGTVGKCGHMTGAREFSTFEEMQSSTWLEKIKRQLEAGIWPRECVRCKLSEDLNGKSLRQDMLERHKILKSIRKDYIMVGGVLDNVCNSACQTCNEHLSTKIGSLTKKDYVKVNNVDAFSRLPLDRITELDINGGEPTASPNYKKLLSQLPDNVMIVRINTNCSRLIPEVEDLLTQGKKIIVTMSLDGIGITHDYVRWPIKWSDYQQNVNSYIELRNRFKNLILNFWTTVSCLNVSRMDDIITYADTKHIDHSYGLLTNPDVFDIRMSNELTRLAKKKLSCSEIETCRQLSYHCASLNDNQNDLVGYIKSQDKIRNISIQNYFNFNLNLS